MFLLYLHYHKRQKSRPGPPLAKEDELTSIPIVPDLNGEEQISHSLVRPLPHARGGDSLYVTPVEPAEEYLRTSMAPLFKPPPTLSTDGLETTVIEHDENGVIAVLSSHDEDLSTLSSVGPAAAPHPSPSSSFEENRDTRFEPFDHLLTTVQEDDDSMSPTGIGTTAAVLPKEDDDVDDLDRESERLHGDLASRAPSMASSTRTPIVSNLRKTTITKEATMSSANDSPLESVGFSPRENELSEKNPSKSNLDRTEDPSSSSASAAMSVGQILGDLLISTYDLEERGRDHDEIPGSDFDRDDPRSSKVPASVDVVASSVRTKQRPMSGSEMFRLDPETRVASQTAAAAAAEQQSGKNNNNNNTNNNSNSNTITMVSPPPRFLETMSIPAVTPEGDEGVSTKSSEVWGVVPLNTRNTTIPDEGSDAKIAVPSTGKIDALLPHKGEDDDDGSGLSDSSPWLMEAVERTLGPRSVNADMESLQSGMSNRSSSFGRHRHSPEKSNTKHGRRNDVMSSPDEDDGRQVDRASSRIPRSRSSDVSRGSELSNRDRSRSFSNNHNRSSRHSRVSDSRDRSSAVISVESSLSSPGDIVVAGHEIFIPIPKNSPKATLQRDKKRLEQQLAALDGDRSSSRGAGCDNATTTSSVTMASVVTEGTDRSTSIRSSPQHSPHHNPRRIVGRDRKKKRKISVVVPPGKLGLILINRYVLDTTTKYAINCLSLTHSKIISSPPCRPSCMIGMTVTVRSYLKSNQQVLSLDCFSQAISW